MHCKCAVYDLNSKLAFLAKKKNTKSLQFHSNKSIMLSNINLTILHSIELLKKEKKKEKKNTHTEMSSINDWGGKKYNKSMYLSSSKNLQILQ
jgi:hypothetical protein